MPAAWTASRSCARSATTRSCAARRSSSSRSSPGSEALAGEWSVTKPIDADELADAMGSAMLAGPRPRAGRRALGRCATDLRAALAELGIDHEWATSGAEAARLCAERRFEVALVDAGHAPTRGGASPAWTSAAAACAGRSSSFSDGDDAPGLASSTPSRSRRGGRRGRAGRALEPASPRPALAAVGSGPVRADDAGQGDRSQPRWRDCGRSSRDRRASGGAKERQLERYAADLRETFKQERARSLRAASAPTGRPSGRWPTPWRRATPTRASTPSASPPTASRSPRALERAFADDAGDRVRLPAARRRQGRGPRRDPASSPSR